MRRWSKTAAGVVTTGVAVFAAGAAITAGLVTGGFSPPPPACYLSAPASGATLTGSVTLTGTCGSSTVNTQFLLDGTFIIGNDGSSPFSVSWNSASFANGAHTLTVFACDISGSCVQSNSIPVTTSNASAPVNTVSPNVTGTLTVGSVLTATTGTWTGDVSSGYTYQWKDAAGNIAAATSSTYTIASGENAAFIHVTVTATGTGGSTSADSNTVGPISNPGALTTAHVWISSAGSSACTRNSGLVTYSAAVTAGNVCDTGPHAYTVASLGDNILVEGAPFTVTSQWNFTKTLTKAVTNGTCNYNYGGSADFSNCESIQPATGQSLTFNVAGTNVVQITDCVSGLSIQNATITDTTYTDTHSDTVSNYALQVGASDNLCGTTGEVHDVYFANITYGGPVLQRGSYNTWFVGGTAASSHDLPWNMGSTGDNGTLPATATSGVVGITFQGANFANTDPVNHHMECVHMAAAFSSFTVAGSRFDQCPVQSLFFSTDNGNETNALVENNYFDAGSGGGPLKLKCAGTPCTLSSFTVRFNSFAGGGWLLECSATGSGCNMNNDVFYGNLGIGCQAVSFTAGGSITGTGVVDSGYNVQSVAKANTCTSATSAYSATITYASSGSPNFNLDLNGAQTATGFVTVGSGLTLPGANIYGVSRSFPTNAGAE